MSLADKALLVSLSISQWQARKLDRKVTEDVAYQHGVSTVSGRYNKVLLPGAVALADIHAKTSIIRKEFYMNTLPWGIEGTQILPSKNLLKFRTWYEKEKSEWLALVDKFVQQYPDLINRAKYNLKDMFNELDYPQIDTIVSRFSIDLAVMPVPDTDFRVASGLLSESEIEELKGSLTKQLSSAQENAMREVWRRMYDRVETFTNKIADPSAIFKDSLVHNIMGMCEILKRLNFADDTEFEEIRRRIEKSVASHNPDMLRLDPEYRETAHKEASCILELMKDKV